MGDRHNIAKSQAWRIVHQACLDAVRCVLPSHQTRGNLRPHMREIDVSASDIVDVIRQHVQRHV